MNPQEYEALRSLLTQLVEILGVKKDPEADCLVGKAVARQPDAPFVLVRGTLLFCVALQDVGRKIDAPRTKEQESVSDPPWGFGSPPEAIAAALALERRTRARR